MTILEFSNKIAAKKPTGWTFWTGVYAADYNREKNVTDTLVMVLPQWPVLFKTDQCKSPIKVEFWFLKKTSIINSTTGTQQHNPNDSLEAMVAVETVINAFFTSLQLDAGLLVRDVSNIEFMPTPAGGTVNAQSVSKVTASITVYHT